MDFDLTETQTTVRELAGTIFDRHADPQHLAKVEASDDRFDRVLWHELAEAGVLGLTVPTGYGGAGLDVAEFVPALTEQGRRVCLAPLWESVLGGMALARFGTADQQGGWLPRIRDGSAVVTAALERGSAIVRATGSDGGWTLTGGCRAVASGHVADAVIVPARTEDGSVELFLVEIDQPGIQRVGYQRTDRGGGADLILGAARAERLGDGAGEDRSGWLLPRAWVGLAALQLGVSQQSVQQTAAYLSQRHQFGVPLGTFQAAAHQVANCHIDSQAMEVTLWNAVWRLATDRPAVAAAHVAKWWSADGGDRIARTVQHLHGGIGADVTYPIHRYLLWSSQLANTLGSASWHLHQVGGHIAAGTA
jgi:3-oxocholest-4-en-26-oyl-CoA dehydrogenase beta subunit